jgi:alkylation response protein AidB-like acyl-CoA dehydrogenase
MYFEGGKVFISDAHRAGFGLVFARTGGPGSGRDGIRGFREPRIRRIGEGTTEAQRMVVSRDLLRATGHRALWEA